MMQQKRAIGTVAYLGGLQAMLEPFAWSWGQMVQYNAEFLAPPGAYVHTYRARISDHAVARNAIVEHMQGDWVVMMDTDHEFEPDIVGRMVRAANEYGFDVLSAVYRMRHPPHYPVLYEWMPNPVDPDGEPVLRQILGWAVDSGYIEIGSAGGGCLFVRRSVFDRIRDELGEAPFDHIATYSEDHSFFLRLRRLGITPFAALHMHSHHLRLTAVTDGDYAFATPDVVEMEVGGMEAV
jgi:glycosyltransferase involved in cell wall biosynthesis